MEDSSFGRLFGVLFSPGKTFRAIAERPTWLVAFLVLALAAAATGFVTGQRTDQRDMIVQQIRDSGRDVPEAQLEQSIQMMEKAGPFIYAVISLFFVVVFSLIGALLYWVAFKVQGSDFSYKSSLAVTLYSGVPAILSLLLSIPVILSRPLLTYADMKRSGGGSLLQSNLAFLAPENAPSWLTALYASLDFFSLWGLVLAIIGFRALSRKSTGTVTVTVVLIWLIFVGVRVGLAALR